MAKGIAHIDHHFDWFLDWRECELPYAPWCSEPFSAVWWEGCKLYIHLQRIYHKLHDHVHRGSMPFLSVSIHLICDSIWGMLMDLTSCQGNSFFIHLNYAAFHTNSIRQRVNMNMKVVSPAKVKPASGT
jgi:hypothetical protein